MVTKHFTSGNCKEDRKCFCGCFVFLSFQSFEFHSKLKLLLYLHDCFCHGRNLGICFLSYGEWSTARLHLLTQWTVMSPAQLIALSCNLSAPGASCSKCQLLLCEGHAIVSRHCGEVRGTLFIVGSAGTEIKWKMKYLYVRMCYYLPCTQSRCGSGSHGRLFYEGDVQTV